MNGVKRGRPTKDENPRDRRFMFRLSEKEYEELEYWSNKSGKDKSEILREAFKMWRNLAKYQH